MGLQPPCRLLSPPGQAQGIWVKGFNSPGKLCPVQSCWQSGFGVFVCLLFWFVFKQPMSVWAINKILQLHLKQNFPSGYYFPAENDFCWHQEHAEAFDTLLSASPAGAGGRAQGLSWGELWGPGCQCWVGSEPLQPVHALQVCARLFPQFSSVSLQWPPDRWDHSSRAVGGVDYSMLPSLLGEDRMQHQNQLVAWNINNNLWRLLNK